MDMNRVKRTRVYWMPVSELIKILRSKSDAEILAVEIGGKPLPDDADIVDVWYENRRHCFGVAIWSSEFDVVPQFEQSPCGNENEPHFILLLKRKKITDDYEPMGEIGQKHIKDFPVLETLISNKTG